MGYSYKAILNKDSRESKTGKHSIFIRVTVDRKSKYFNLGERVDGRYCTGKENRWIRENHPFAFELNAIIKKKMDLLHEYEYRQKLFGNGISLESIAEHFHKKADPHVFNEYVAEFMKVIKGKSLNTLKKYKTFVKYLDEFNPRLGFSQLNEQLFQSFATWLERKGMMGVTVYKYFDPFKVIVKQAVKRWLPGEGSIHARGPRHKTNKGKTRLSRDRGNHKAEERSAAGGPAGSGGHP